MTLFDRVLQPQTTDAALSPQEAVVGVLLAAANADAQASRAELARLDQRLGSMKLFRHATAEQLTAVAQTMMSVITTQGVSAILTQAATLLPAALRATVFTLATDLVLADGDADEEEKAFIDSLQRRSGLTKRLP
jgi:hypothetical protein